MANPFDVEVVNPLQALLIGQQAYSTGMESNKRQAVEMARTEASNMLASGDRQGAIAKLLALDPQAASPYIQLDNNDWTRRHTTERDAVSDKRWQAEHGLRVQAANEGKFGIKEVTDPNTGQTTLVRVKLTGPEGPIQTGIAPSSGLGNPFGGGKFNEGQGKAAGFSDRMLQSEGILSGVGVAPNAEGPPSPGVQSQGASLAQTGLSKTPVIGNYLVSKDRQKYEQAKRDFINAQLRRESGAVISPEEFANADKQYFPVPGDERHPEIIQQKAANRRVAIEAMGREGGPSYRPKFNFDQNGTVVPYGQATSRRPISQKEYESLPRGSVFIAPDGSERVKP